MRQNNQPGDNSIVSRHIPPFPFPTQPPLESIKLSALVVRRAVRCNKTQYASALDAFHVLPRPNQVRDIGRLLKMRCD